MCEAHHVAARTWLKRVFPAVVAVLLVGVAGGLLARSAYRTSAGAPEQTSSTPPSSGITFSPDAATHPDHERVRWLLETHFNAINFRQYDTWKTTVVPEKWQELPRDKWMREYRTTRDSDIVVHRIEPGDGNSLQVLLTFTSTQDPADAPAELPLACVRWQVVYSLVDAPAGIRLDTSKLPGNTLVSRCE